MSMVYKDFPYNSNGTCPLVGYHYNVQNLVNVVKERNIQGVRDLSFARAFYSNQRTSISIYYYTVVFKKVHKISS